MPKSIHSGRLKRSKISLTCLLYTHGNMYSDLYTLRMTKILISTYICIFIVVFTSRHNYCYLSLACFSYAFYQVRLLILIKLNDK